MSDLYYLNDEQQPVGPMSLEGILKLVDAGIVDSRVLVCPAGDQEWKPLPERNEDATASVGPPRVPPPPRSHPSASAALPSTSSQVLPDWLAPVAMGAGILSLFTTFLPALAVLIAVPAIVGGTMVLRRAASTKRGFALTAVLTGGLGALPALLFILGMFFGMLTQGGGGVADMERALKRGVEIGRDASKRFPNDATGQSRFIATELQKVDTRGCPPEFRVAYQSNVEAWEIAIPYFEADNPLTSFLEGVYGGLSDDYSVIGTSNYQAGLAAENINETYQQLKMTAVALGARIPAM
jgi:hypothetical protein